MTLQQAIDHVRQNIAEKLSGNTVLTQSAFLSDVVNLYIVPDIVSMHDWSWKYEYVDQSIASGAHKFTPDVSSLGAGVILDDLFRIVLLTGTRGTTKVIEGRNPGWFLERYPDPSLEEKGRADYFTLIGAAGGSKNEVWLSQPTDAAYTARLVLFKTFATVALGVELGLRADKHMLVVAGATSYAFAALEQLHPTDQGGVDSPASWWLRLYLDGVEKWWQQDQSRAHITTTLGRYEPRVAGRAGAGEYWKNPFIRSLMGD